MTRDECKTFCKNILRIMNGTCTGSATGGAVIGGISEEIKLVPFLVKSLYKSPYAFLVMFFSSVDLTILLVLCHCSTMDQGLSRLKAMHVLLGYHPDLHSLEQYRYML